MSVTAIGVVLPLIILLILLIFYFIRTYNKFIRIKETIDNSRVQVTVQTESRWDALTSLMEATRQYSSHEVSTLESVVKQRSGVSRDMSPDELFKSDEVFDSSLARLIAVSESYPELKASEIYSKTMDSITFYEKRVRLARMSYNDIVTKYNRMIKSIPTNIIASIMGFNTERYLKGATLKDEMPSWK